MTQDTTIAALVTAPAPAGVAVVRISGPGARDVLGLLFSAQENPIDHPRKLIYGKIRNAGDAEILDHALAVFMPGPNSYTGEDTVEFQIHGSLAIAQALLRSIFSCGVQPAGPGEFTRRAFINGKIDLVQAEAVADLINAGSTAAVKLAQEQLEGRFSCIIEKLAEPLRNALAEIEASIDFPEEEIETARRDQLLNVLDLAVLEIKRLLETYSYGRHVREGFRVWLCGLPNAGKSSLFNALLGNERAIVTPVSGTTRDVLEERCEIGGCTFVLCDAAGIREASDEVEKIGVELARRRADWADLVLLVADLSEPGDRWKELLPFLGEKGCRTWLVGSKVDLAPGRAFNTGMMSSQLVQVLNVSVFEGTNLTLLKKMMVEEFQSSLPLTGESLHVVTNERHRNCLSRGMELFEKARAALDSSIELEFVSVDLRSGLRALEEILGRTWTEDILGRIFSRFCIGK